MSPKINCTCYIIYIKTPWTEEEEERQLLLAATQVLLLQHLIQAQLEMELHLYTIITTKVMIRHHIIHSFFITGSRTPRNQSHGQFLFQTYRRLEEFILNQPIIRHQIWNITLWVTFFSPFWYAFKVRIVLTDLFFIHWQTGPRDMSRHTKWPIFLRMDGSILPRLILPLIFMAGWSTMITCVSLLVHPR